jgi:hypothetical protein
MMMKRIQVYWSAGALCSSLCRRRLSSLWPITQSEIHSSWPTDAESFLARQKELIQTFKLIIAEVSQVMAASDGGNLLEKATPDVEGEQARVERDECERRLARALSSPSVVVLTSALRRFGCDVTIAPWRHFVCERCSPQVDGGYDADTNQVNHGLPSA